MPITQDKNHIDQEELSQALMAAANRDREIAQTYGYRVKEIDTLEDEIIEKYANSSGLKLNSNPSLLDCIAAQTAGQAILNRVTEIELQSVRIATKLKAQREPIATAILNALGSSGSAESRRAKASGATEAANLLISLEEGLLVICETARKNIRSAIETASRAQTAIQHEVQYLDGAGVAKELIDQTRGKFN